MVGRKLPQATCIGWLGSNQNFKHRFITYSQCQVGAAGHYGPLVIVSNGLHVNCLEEQLIDDNVTIVIHLVLFIYEKLLHVLLAKLKALIEEQQTNQEHHDFVSNT